MKNYIEREALMKRMEERLASLRKEYGNYDHYTDGYEEGCVAVEYASASDVVERKRGRWLEIDGEVFECDMCHGIRTEYKYNFCPDCGADMREVDHETD